MKDVARIAATFAYAILSPLTQAIDVETPYDLSKIDWGDSKVSVREAFPDLKEVEFRPGTGMESSEFQWRGIKLSVLVSFDEANGLRGALFFPSPNPDNRVEPGYNAFEKILREEYGKPTNEVIGVNGYKSCEWSLRSTFVKLVFIPSRTGVHGEQASLSYKAPNTERAEQD